MSKRDTLMVHIKWYYRTNEVPEQVYQLLIQDRNTEHNNMRKNKKKKNAETDGEDSSQQSSTLSSQNGKTGKSGKTCNIL
jgi:hypothetical protein